MMQKNVTSNSGIPVILFADREGIKSKKQISGSLAPLTILGKKRIKMESNDKNSKNVIQIATMMSRVRI
jgi:hypothetical protein